MDFGWTFSQRSANLEGCVYREDDPNPIMIIQKYQIAPDSECCEECRKTQQPTRIIRPCNMHPRTQQATDFTRFEKLVEDLTNCAEIVITSILGPNLPETLRKQN